MLRGNGTFFYAREILTKNKKACSVCVETTAGAAAGAPVEAAAAGAELRRRRTTPTLEELSFLCSHQRCCDRGANPRAATSDDGFFAFEHVAPPRERRLDGRGSSCRHGCECVCAEGGEGREQRKLQRSVPEGGRSTTERREK